MNAQSSCIIKIRQQALLVLEISGPSPFESLELLAYEIFLPLINNQQNQVSWLVSGRCVCVCVCVPWRMYIPIHPTTNTHPSTPHCKQTGQVGRDGHARGGGPLLRLPLRRHHPVRTGEI